MNIAEYISSGILETYAIGALSATEMAEVENALSNSAELREELLKIRAVLEDYALNQEVEVPNLVKENLFETLFESSDNSTKESAKNLNITSENHFYPDSKSVVKPKNNRFAWLAAACVALLISNIGFYVFYQNQIQKSYNKIAQLENQNQQIAQDFQILQNQMGKMVDLKSPDLASVVMNGLETSPDAMVMIYWDKKAQKTYLSVHNLPEPPDGKQYQLWAIDGENVLDAGVFEFQEAYRKPCEMNKFVRNANAFAITLEKRGGVPKAEGEMYVLGEL